MAATAKANKLHKPRPSPRRLRGGLDPTAENRETLKLGGATVKLPKLLALDTETTGLDYVHGCRPFFVSTCDADGNLQFWEWDVNPLTRNVGCFVDPLGYPVNHAATEDCPWGIGAFVILPPKKELAELTALLRDNRFVLHNAKFDTHHLECMGLPRLNLATAHDTLIASHVLCSNEPHGLKELALKYLDILDDDQKELRDAVNEARRIGRQLGWQVAEGPHPHFPAQKQAPTDGWWVYDTWLPRMVAKYKWEVEGDPDYAPPGQDVGYHEESGKPYHLTDTEAHPWWTVLRRYALRDVERTYGLHWVFTETLVEQEKICQYEERRQLLEAIYEMECNGCTITADRLEDVSEKILLDMEAMAEECFALAGAAPQPAKPVYSFAQIQAMKKKEREALSEQFVFDNLNSPKQLETLLFDCWKLKTTKRTDGGARSTDSEVLTGLKERASGPALKFVENLQGFRKRDKALAYINEYRIRSTEEFNDALLIYLLRGSFNITGTDTTRFSSSGPNFQNISKKEYKDDEGIVIKDLNLRRMFGPAPGREWYSGDYSNIELRIFAWESGDENLINAFLEGYSVHLLFAELLYEKQWAECVADARSQLGFEGILKPNHRQLQRRAGDIFKKVFESTWYQWVKNGDFSLIYGAGREKADRTYHRPGAYDLIRNRMPEIDHFLMAKHQQASVHGYIECLGGYRLFVPVTEPHKAVNYFVQGTAGWFMTTAINRVHRYLKDLNRKVTTPSGHGYDRQPYKMIMTIHDELVFDFPQHPRNLEVIAKVKSLMEESGKPFGIPTPVEFDLHADNWAEGQKLEL